MRPMKTAGTVVMRKELKEPAKTCKICDVSAVLYKVTTYNGKRASVRRKGILSIARPGFPGRLLTKVTLASGSPCQRLNRLCAWTSWPPKRKCMGGATSATLKHLFGSWLVSATGKVSCDPYLSASPKLCFPSAIISCRNSEDIPDS